MRKLGLDYGDARIGLSLSDPMGIIASPYETFHRTKDLGKDVGYIAELVKLKEVDAVIVGLPVNMDGSSGERVERTKEFVDELVKVIPVKFIYVDERLTTVASEKLLIDANVRRDKRKEVIDKLAAQLILQSYLDNPVKYKPIN